MSLGKSPFNTLMTVGRNTGSLEIPDQVEETGWLAGRASDDECPAALFDDKAGSDEAAEAAAVHEGDPGEVDRHCRVVACVDTRCVVH